MISVKNNVDIIVYINNLLGFEPKSSVVVVMLNDEKVHGCARVDANPDAPANAWAQQVGSIFSEVQGINRTVLVSFENEQSLTLDQFDALGDELAKNGMPIHRALLVTANQVMDFEGDSTDAVTLEDLASHPLNLEFQFQAGKNRSFENIPKLQNGDGQLTAERGIAAGARFLETGAKDYSDPVVALELRGEIESAVAQYKSAGEVSPELAGWLSGTVARKLARDFVTLSSVTSAPTIETAKDHLLGKLDIEDREFFNDMSDMLFDALAFTPITQRAHLLVIIGWQRWMMGKSSEALKFLKVASEGDPTCELAQLLTVAIASGNLIPVSALKNS